MTGAVTQRYDFQQVVIEDETMREKLVSLLLSSLMVLVMGTAVSGCSTIEGAGKDIEKAGEAIRDAARNASD